MFTVHRPVQLLAVMLEVVLAVKVVLVLVLMLIVEVVVRPDEHQGKGRKEEIHRRQRLSGLAMGLPLF